MPAVAFCAIISSQAPARAEYIRKEIAPLEIKLSKDAAYLLLQLYRSYQSKRNFGKSKREANYFINSHYIHEYLLPNWQFDDVDDTCRELSRANIIHVTWADNIANDISINDLGIVTMENINLDKVKDAASIVNLVISAFGSLI